MANKLGAAEPQTYKVEAVQQFQEAVQEAGDLFFVGYQGLSVAEITDLRKKLSVTEATLKVVKNTYSRLALKGAGKELPSEWLTGATAIVLCYGESSPVAKALVDFAKEMEIFELKGGYIDGETYDVKSVKSYSAMPTKDELIAKMMGSMNAPVTNTALLLNNIMSSLVRALDQVGKQKSE